MKKKMTCYLNELVGDDMEMLEKLISHQYRKFIRFYRLIEEYSGMITKMRYEFNSESSLDVTVSFDTKRKMENIKSELESLAKDGDYELHISVNKKTLNVSVVLDENN